MIKSMTGFAAFQSAAGDHRVSWELRSVNHRFLDVNLRLPDELGLVAGADLDLWSINEDESFHEEVREGPSRGTVQDRGLPSRAESDVDELLRNAFARYDEVALGGAVGITASLTLAVATLAASLVRKPLPTGL